MRHPHPPCKFFFSSDFKFHCLNFKGLKSTKEDQWFTMDLSEKHMRCKAFPMEGSAAACSVPRARIYALTMDTGMSW